MSKVAKKLSVAFLFDDTLDSSDGVAQYVKTLGSWLSSQGHAVSYLVGQTKIKTWDNGQVFSLARNVGIRWAGNKFSIPAYPRMELIQETLKSHNFDVVHVQVPYSPFMAGQIINLLPPSTAVVGTFHVFPGNNLSLYGSKFLKMSYGKSLKRFDTHLAVSPAAQNYALRAFSISSSILPNVVDISKFRSANSAANTNPNKIVFLGRLVERKGCRYLINAFSEVKKDFPDLSLTIAGAGPLRAELEKLTFRKGIADSVEFLGFIDEVQKRSLLASASIACFPSLYGESFGIVLIEAMAAGSGVVIGGDNPGYRSTLNEMDDTLFNPKNIIQFSLKIKKILNNTPMANRIHSTQQRLVKKYDVNLVGKKIEDVYNEAIAKRTVGRHN